MLTNITTIILLICFNPFSPNFTKWSNTPKQFVGNSPTNCLSVFDHFVKFLLKWLNLNPILANLIHIYSKKGSLFMTFPGHLAFIKY